MNVKRPAGLETRVDELYVYHSPMDNCVESLDVEDLPFNCGHWELKLRIHMRVQNFEWLHRHYPELFFGWAKARPNAKSEIEFFEERGSGWITARWKTAKQSKREEKLP